jgi:hypothetical protein
VAERTPPPKRRRSLIYRVMERCYPPSATVLPALSTGKEEGDPVKKIGLVVNLAERTVTMSGVSVAAHIDSADAASISFVLSATEVPYSFSAAGLRGTGTMTVIVRPADIQRLRHMGAGARGMDGARARRGWSDWLQAWRGQNLLGAFGETFDMQGMPINQGGFL